MLLNGTNGGYVTMIVVQAPLNLFMAVRKVLCTLRCAIFLNFPSNGTANYFMTWQNVDVAVLYEITVIDQFNGLD